MVAKIIIGTRPVRLAWNVFPIIRVFMSDGTVQKRMGYGLLAVSYKTEWRGVRTRIARG